MSAGKNIIYGVVLMLWYLSPGVCNGAVPEFTVDGTEDIPASNFTDDYSRTLREGPVNIEETGGSVGGVFPFINMRDNVISYNGDDWSELRSRYSYCDTSMFTFLHIGDSHMQADIATSQIRKKFQKSKGNGGRGLIVPLKLAGTNEPVDFRFTIDCPYRSSRLLKRPWDSGMDFTGISIAPSRKTFELKIETLGDTPDKFRFVRLYVSDGFGISDVYGNDGKKLLFSIDRDFDDGYADVFLSESVSELTISCRCGSFITFHGAVLSSEYPGVLYHVIGNNGATYSAYNSIPTFGSRLTSLYPDLIILSLGTNDAFGKISSSEFYAQIHTLVSEIQYHNPEAKILLTTPMECQQRIRSGSKRRAASYRVVDGIRRLRDVILCYGKEHSIPVYDWWAVAGGDGASTKWLSKSLLGKDRVHLTKEGYILMGNLLYEALARALSN